MIISLKGENFTGKSGFALGCPQRIAWYETDIGGMRRALGFKPEVADAIDYHAYPTPEQYQMKELGLDTSPRLYGMKELWYQFVNDFLADLKNPDIKTYNIDTFSQMYSTASDAYLQEIQEDQEVNGELPKDRKYRQQLQQMEYRWVNQRLHALFDIAAKHEDKTFIFTHHMTDLYGRVLDSEGKVTKDVVGRDAKGWHNCGYATADLVDYVILMEKGDPKKLFGQGKQDPKKFYSTILKPGDVRALYGMVIEDLTYDILMQRIAMAKG